MKLVIALAVLAVARAADASCAFVEMGPHVLTPRDATIAPGGGVVVGFGMKGKGPAADKGGDPSVSSAYTFGATPAVRESLAPGLSVYRPKSRVTKYRFDVKGYASAGTFDAAASAPTLPAPVVTAIALRPAFRGQATAIATLGADAPAGAIALIVYDGTTPLTYGQPSPGNRDVTVLEGGHCSFPPGNGPTKGASVTFAWVDASGRVSAHSAPVVTTQIGKDLGEP